MSSKNQNPVTSDDVYFGAVISAYINNSFEKDRTFLTLCPAAIGLMTTVVITVGINSWLEAIFYITSSLSFGFTTYHLLKVFDLNKLYLKLLVKNKRSTLDKFEKKLKAFDKCSFYGFMIGIVLFFLFGLTTAYTQLTIKREDHNANKKHNFQLIQIRQERALK